MPDLAITAEAKHLVKLPQLLYGDGFADFKLPDFQNTAINGELIVLQPRSRRLPVLRHFSVWRRPILTHSSVLPYKSRAGARRRKHRVWAPGGLHDRGYRPSSANIYAVGEPRCGLVPRRTALGLVLAVPFLLNLIPSRSLQCFGCRLQAGSDIFVQADVVCRV